MATHGTPTPQVLVPQQKNKNCVLRLGPFDGAITLRQNQSQESGLESEHCQLEIYLYCWFSHDVTKFQTSEPLILLRFYFHDE